MAASQYRKIELQSPADLSYLYTNTVNLSRRKLDLHLPPPSNNNNGDSNARDPMKERVKELVDEFISKTFTSACASISINGLDFNDVATTSNVPGAEPPSLNAFLAPPTETVEYEPYDGVLAARVTALYAQLESLTTTVAQLRRDAPKRAAGMYAEALTREFENDEEEEVRADSKAEGEALVAADRSIVLVSNEDQSSLDNEPSRKKRKRGGRKSQESSVAVGGEGNATTDERPGWKLNVPFGSKNELERWRNGEMAEVFSQTLRTLLHLQGEVQAQNGRGDSEESSVTALATTIGKAERAGRAAEVVENMLI